MRTAHGRHEPAALDRDGLQQIIDARLADADPVENVLGLFVDLARAQPFEDGNKRTAVFVANGLLLGSGTGVLLTIPYDEDDPGVAASFNDLLARAYLFAADQPVTRLLRERGLDAVRNPL